MANESPKPAAPASEQPVYPYPFPPGPFPPTFFTYPPPPTDPANSSAETNGVTSDSAPRNIPPYVFPYPPPPGMFYTFQPAAFAPPHQQPSSPSPSRPKRSQVKMACTNCAQACKRCDDQRPCTRCEKYNMQDSCVDGTRKERRKGIKRGPYKRRSKEATADNINATTAAFAAGNGTPVTAPLPGSAPAANGSVDAPVAQGAPPSAPVPMVLPPGVVPQPFPAPPEGYPAHMHPPPGAFYPQMVFLAAPPPGVTGEDGAPAAPIPYFYPYPPFGLLPPPFQPGSQAPTEAKKDRESDGKDASTEEPKTNGVNGDAINGHTHSASVPGAVTEDGEDEKDDEGDQDAEGDDVDA